MTGETAPRRNLDQEARENLERLRNNPYPGRGIVIGESGTGDITQVYWIMGRSQTSRNRILVQEGNIVRTDLFDKTSDADTSLIIYNAMNIVKNVHVVSNGDQTDSIVESLKSDAHIDLEHALSNRTYEPDAPNFTPRISGASWLSRTADGMGVVTKASSKLSIIRKGVNVDSIRDTTTISGYRGIGYCIHTYKGDGNPLPSFTGAPYPVPIGETADQTADLFWNVLNDENKVALVVKTIHFRSGEISYAIRNKLSAATTATP